MQQRWLLDRARPAARRDHGGQANDQQRSRNHSTQAQSMVAQQKGNIIEILGEV